MNSQNICCLCNTQIRGECQTLNCKHVYHKKCITNWIYYNIEHKIFNIKCCLHFNSESKCDGNVIMNKNQSRYFNLLANSFFKCPLENNGKKCHGYISKNKTPKCTVCKTKFCNKCLNVEHFGKYCKSKDVYGYHYVNCPNNKNIKLYEPISGKYVYCKNCQLNHDWKILKDLIRYENDVDLPNDFVLKFKDNYINNINSEQLKQLFEEQNLKYENVDDSNIKSKKFSEDVGNSSKETQINNYFQVQKKVKSEKSNIKKGYIRSLHKNDVEANCKECDKLCSDIFHDLCCSCNFIDRYKDVKNKVLYNRLYKHSYKCNNCSC